MSVLIKNIIFNGKKQDIFVEGNCIKKIGVGLNLRAGEKIDGEGAKAALPGLINCHTHAAMNLFRGYGDDLPLKIWLEKKIWPLESKMTEDDVYWGAKLACLEMVKSGTTCFNDMYWHALSTIEAASEMGLRAFIGSLIIDFDEKGSKENFEKNYRKFAPKKSDLIKLIPAPHSVYAVAKENLLWAKNFAQKNNLILHIHISETEKEAEDCERKQKIRPVEYLQKIGFLGPNVVLAHGVWLSEKEIKILAERRCNLVYNPCSNLKLASGIMPYQKLKRAGVNICLGTDGAASNNNLDMFEEMKVGSLIQKNKENSPTVASAEEALNWATLNGAKALRINSGEIKEGKIADLILIDLNSVCFSPGHDFISDVVYAASGSAVTDSVCNGRIIMRDRKIEGEEVIIKKASSVAKNLVEKF